MDVDNDTPSEYGNITLFDLSPSTFPFRHPRPREIETRRAKLSDLLIFDILLSTGGISEPDALYPPTDPESLRRLLDAIETCQYDGLKKDCLIYFLLKWHEDGRAEQFAEESSLPPQFVALADAYWHLDSGIDVPKAVALLSDARLNRDYASKILQALSLHPQASSLVVKYVRTAKPPLTEPDDIDTYALAILDSGLLEAWFYQRSFPERSDTRSRLLRKILDWCLSPFPKGQHLAQMLAFPFSSYEQVQVHNYALRPPSSCPPSSIHVIQDLVCVRLIQAGQYAAAIKLDRQFAVGARTGANEKAAQDRRRMMDDIMATMPDIERQLLEVELEDIADGREVSKDLGVSMSWEDMGISVSGSARTPVVERNGTVRSSSSAVIPLSSLGKDKRALREPVTAVPFAPILDSPSFSAVQPSVLPLSSSVSGPSSFVAPAIKPGRFAPNPAIRSSPTAAPPASLFGSARSANQTRNAFYDPPPSKNGQATTAKIPPLFSAATAQVPPPAVEEDMTMDSDDEILLSTRNRRRHVPGHSTERPPAEIPFSVFSNGTAAGDDRANRPAAGRRSIGKEGSVLQTLPGAYVADQEEPVEQPKTQARLKKLPSPSPPPPPRTRRTRIEKEADVPSPSIPGALDQEEDDYIAPLPPTPPAKRKARTTRASTGEMQEPTRPRRSSRLSTTPSAASASPERITPPRTRAPRKSTKGAGASVSAKSSTRTSKKRS